MLRLGKEKASTRLSEGGSGIGYMTVFGILRECKASLVITEYEPEQQGFTKSVAVRFDDGDKYTVKTCRADELRALLDAEATSDDRLTILDLWD